MMRRAVIPIAWLWLAMAIFGYALAGSVTTHDDTPIEKTSARCCEHRTESEEIHSLQKEG